MTNKIVLKFNKTKRGYFIGKIVAADYEGKHYQKENVKFKDGSHVKVGLFHLWREFEITDFVMSSMSLYSSFIFDDNAILLMVKVGKNGSVITGITNPDELNVLKFSSEDKRGKESPYEILCNYLEKLVSKN